ncbi:hypothetical protein ACHQM5_013262 [Ranunculus cassubicifolius]
MEIDSDQTLIQKSESLYKLTTSTLSSSISKLSNTSRGIPSGEDFHFYYNFNEFKSPIKEIIQKSESTLKLIGSNTSLWDGKDLNFPDELDEAYDWLVNVNDEIFEKFDFCVDEFDKARKLEEENGKSRGSGSSIVDDDGFQVVGRRNKGGNRKDAAVESSPKSMGRDARTSSSVRPRVPFHVPSIVRPQSQFKIVVDNSNEKFEHVWLEKSEDEERFVHPLESFSERDFIDKEAGNVEPVKPHPLLSTKFMLVEEVKDLKILAAKLQDVNEFAVDLEHNQYRSFQGLTCLMQISTRTEDFVVDTLKLHAHVGPHLRELFKDPSKKKVMHGADRDILWLQRDFGIYVCNLFDTGQASRVLKLERNSLEYLLLHFCGVTANKEYQNADWRVRPIPDEMLRYAREDTHYLLYIYDLMRVRLLEESTDSENVNALLLEVYKRSYDVCTQLYEKDIQTDTSYLHIYGVQGADLNSEQLAVVSGLCEWRDHVARAEDESTGFILPNKAVLEIARQMPLTASKLRRVLNSRHSYLERNLGSVVNVIKKSIENASNFEDIAEQLHKARVEMETSRNTEVADNEPEALMDTEFPTEVEEHTNGEMPLKATSSTVECGTGGEKSMDISDEVGDVKKEVNNQDSPKNLFSHAGQVSGEATVQVLKKPSRAFGALFGKSASKRKICSDPKVDVKVEQIKSSVTLPFQTFSSTIQQSEPKTTSTTSPTEPVSMETDSKSLEDIISLQPESNGNESPDEQMEETTTTTTTGEQRPMSLSELSTGFQNCYKKAEKIKEAEYVLQLKPFDYAAAREEMRFGERREEIVIGEDGKKTVEHSKERKKKSNSRVKKDEGPKEFQGARRRMAFPPSGNRSATYN